jgi:hypothetical protein
LKVENQAIELADTLSAQFEQGTGDGLLGLAFSNINTVKPQAVRTPVENMIAQEDIPKSAELFTAKLGSWKDADEPDKGESFYTFGFIDQDTVTASGEEVYYTPIDNSQGFWLFDSASATVNGKTIARSGNKAIADTGTTLALVDDETCQAIYDAIPGAHYDDESQGYIFPSNTTEDKLPVVSFAVGDKQFVVQKEDLCFAEAKSGYVYGGIQSRGSMTMDILGDTFLKGIYAVRSCPFVEGVLLMAVDIRRRQSSFWGRPAKGVASESVRSSVTRCLCLRHGHNERHCVHCREQCLCLIVSSVCRHILNVKELYQSVSLSSLLAIRTYSRRHRLRSVMSETFCFCLKRLRQTRI